jgi:hypothetical protein
MARHLWRAVLREARSSELDPCLAWVRREQKAAAKSARFGVHFTQMYSFPVFTIRVKWPPKPDPVERRPPTTRHFYSTELALANGISACERCQKASSTYGVTWLAVLATYILYFSVRLARTIFETLLRMQFHSPHHPRVIYGPNKL